MAHSIANLSVSNVTNDKPSLACIIPLCLRDETPFGFVETLNVLSVIAIILSVAAVLINGVFILMVYLYQELRSTSNYLLLNLAIVNITFGTASLVSVCIYYQGFIDCAPIICFYRDFFAFCAGVDMALTFTTLSVISIERYICIFYALRWDQIITNRRVVVVVVSLWMFWIGASILLRALDSWPIFQNLFMFQTIVNFAVMVITNAIVYREIRRHEKRIAQEQQVVANAEEIKKAREKKRAKTVILMIALVLMFYIPSLILLLGSRKIPPAHQFTWKTVWLPVRIIFLSHTMFDIMVYGMRTEETRKAFKKVINRFCCL